MKAIRQLRGERETSIGLAARRQQSPKDAQSFRSFWKTSIAVTLTALLISPLYWVLAGSFMTQRELFSPGFHIWPKEVAWDNWLHAFVRLWPHVQSSTIVSLSTTILTLFIAIPAAYTMMWLSVLCSAIMLPGDLQCSLKLPACNGGHFCERAHELQRTR
jgi:ABC-type glycerol-3-phosphate transport system permease component